MSVRLTNEEVEFFHQNGYISLPSITRPEEVQNLRAAFDEIFQSQAGRERGDYFDLAGTDAEGRPVDLPQILGPRQYSPQFNNTLYERNALAIAHQLIGPEAEFREDHAILKPGLTGKPAPWHQDESYWDPNLIHKSISFWMPLQDATLENGCMQFIPCDIQTMPILEHQSIGKDPRVHGLEVVDPVDTSKAIACPIPAGGVTIHGSRTLHYTGPNLTTEPRRAYILNLAWPSKPRPVDQHRAIFHWNAAKHTAREARAAQK